MDSATFYTNNRLRLRQQLKQHVTYQGVTVIAGHSLVQASADRALPFEQDSSFFYLTGLDIPGLVLVFDDAHEFLIIPQLSDVQKAFEGAIDTTEITALSGIEDVVEANEGWERLAKRIKTVSHVASATALESYIDRSGMFANPSRQRLLDAIAEIGQPEILDIRSTIATMRMIKSDYEVDMIEQAISYTGQLFGIIEQLRGTVANERDLAAAITAHRVGLGLVDAYEPIIAGGSNAVTLHYVKNNAPLLADEQLLLDIGLKYRGYSADISRTVASKPTERQQAVYDATLLVQQAAIALLKPGLGFKEYEDAVTEVMGEQLMQLGLITKPTHEAIRKHYPHSTSHFLGIDVHDVGDYRKLLEAGVVMTVEPGIYIPEEGIGVRIEDDLLITQDGSRNLSKQLPKNIRSLTIHP